MIQKTVKSTTGTDLVIPNSLAEELDPSKFDIVMVVPDTSCVQCNSTKRAFDKKGIRYGTVVVSTSEESTEVDAALAEFILSATGGIRQLPFVMSTVDLDNFWSGFRPDCIEKIPAPALAS